MKDAVPFLECARFALPENASGHSNREVGEPNAGKTQVNDKFSKSESRSDAISTDSADDTDRRVTAAGIP